MTNPTPEGTDIDAEQIDLDEPQDLPATSDPEEMVDDDTELGGVGGRDPGGAG